MLGAWLRVLRARGAGRKGGTTPGPPGPHLRCVKALSPGGPRRVLWAPGRGPYLEQTRLLTCGQSGRSCRWQGAGFPRGRPWAEGLGGGFCPPTGTNFSCPSSPVSEHRSQPWRSPGDTVTCGARPFPTVLLPHPLFQSRPQDACRLTRPSSELPRSVTRSPTHAHSARGGDGSSELLGPRPPVETGLGLRTRVQAP